MGQKPTDEEVFNLISTVDEDMSQTIDFPEFLTVIKRQMIEAERSKVDVKWRCWLWRHPLKFETNFRHCALGRKRHFRRVHRLRRQ